MSPEREKKTSPACRRLAVLERQVLADAQKLGIGPMGFGGATTLLGVKIGALTRLPALRMLRLRNTPR